MAHSANSKFRQIGLAGALLAYTLAGSPAQAAISLGDVIKNVGTAGIEEGCLVTGRIIEKSSGGFFSRRARYS